MDLTTKSTKKSTTTTTSIESPTINTPITTTRNTRNNTNSNTKTTPSSTNQTHTTTTITTMSDHHHSNNGSDSRKKPQLFHSVSIIVEPVLDDDSSSIPLVLTPNEIVVTSPGSESTIIPSSVSPSSPILDYDDFIFENQRKKSQEEDEIVQALMANAQLRKEEFARLLEEHAQLVNEINRAETTLL